MKRINITCKGQKYLSINSLKAFQGNLKELHKDEFEKLKRSILKYGFSFPVFVWETSILDGHQRLFVVKEMMKEGYEIGDIPVVEIDAKNQTEAAEKLLLLNSRYAKITDDGLYEFLNEHSIDFNEVKDDLEIPEIDIEDFVSGYLEEEHEGLTDDDEIPEVDEEPKTKLGDLYILGDHRLLCGDATKKEDVERLMDGKKADMVFTDPPYNVDYGANKNHPSWNIRSIVGDKQSDSEWRLFCTKVFTNIKNHCLGDIYMWGAPSPDGMRMRLQLIDMGCHWSATIIWKKQQLVLSPAKYQRKYEPCFYGWFNKSSFKGDRKQTEVWEFDRPLKSELHPTMKPVNLCMNGIVNSCKTGAVVLDLFGGSGSTLIACEKTNRRCYMMEIDPHYCDVIVKRWEDYTGNKAELK